jgi:hypothetical protein
MKLANLFIVSLLFVASIAYCDTISVLQTKKNNTQKNGITYTITFPGEYEGAEPIEYTISEKGKNKLFESKDYAFSKYLLCDDKLYQVPGLIEEFDKNTPVQVTLLNTEKNDTIDVNNKHFKIPDYTNSKILKKATTNGYQCQILQKVLSSKDTENEKGETIKEQNLLKIYVIEKYGYPTKIEYVSISKDAKGKELSKEITKTINFTKFNTNTADKMLSLPDNVIIIDPAKHISSDTKDIKKLINSQRILSEEETPKAFD